MFVRPSRQFSQMTCLSKSFLFSECFLELVFRVHSVPLLLFPGMRMLGFPCLTSLTLTFSQVLFITFFISLWFKKFFSSFTFMLFLVFVFKIIFHLYLIPFIFQTSFLNFSNYIKIFSYLLLLMPFFIFYEMIGYSFHLFCGYVFSCMLLLCIGMWFCSFFFNNLFLKFI